MKDNPKISVIVPVYNVEKYLDKCVQGIINQTYSNLEIILVDDGSPDNCGALCEEYASKDDRIRVFHKENGGLADARNFGLEKMTGEYVAFVDSDDYIHPRMYERMIDAMHKKKVDIVICSWKRVEEDDDEVMQELPEHQDIKSLDRDKLQNDYFDNPDNRITLTVAWNKLYKKEFFNKLRYPVGKVHEDEFVTFKTLYEAKKVVYLNEELYFYMVRDVSIMGNFNSKRFDIFDAYCEKIHYYESQDEYNLIKKVIRIAIHMLVQYYEWIDENDEEAQNKFKHYYKLLKNESARIRTKTGFGTSLKMEIFIFSKNFSLYKFIWETARKIKNK